MIDVANYVSSSEIIRSSISASECFKNISLINPVSFSLEVKELSRELLSFCSRFFSSVDKFFSLPTAHGEEIDVSYSDASREVAHVLGDHYVRKTYWEGWQFQRTQEVALEASQDLSPELQDRISDLVGKIQYISQYDVSNVDLSEQLAQKIVNLKDNESLWLEGGWSYEGGSGHAMLYEFIKRSDSTATQGYVIDAYIYNTGAGLQYHYSEMKNRDEGSALVSDPQFAEVTSPQYYVCPFVKFEGIQPEEIGLFSDQIDGAFFKNLIDAKKLTDESKAAEKIYKESFAPLNHRRVADPRNLEDYFLVLPQYSGTCSWRVLVYAALKKHLGSESEIAEFEIKRHNFMKNCVNKSESSDLGELCFQGGKELLLDMAGLHEVLLPQRDLENDRKTIQQSLDVLRKAKESFSSSFSTQPDVTYEVQPYALDIAVRNAPMLLEHVPKEVKKIVVFPAEPPPVTTISDLKAELERICSYPGKDQPYDVSMQIERLVQTLPRPSQWGNAWQNADEAEIRECITGFGKVLKLYTDTVLASGKRLLTEQNAVWSLLGVIHHMSSRIDPKLKDSYGVYFEPFHNLSKNPFFTNFRREDIELYRELITYFQNLPAKKIFNPEDLSSLDLNPDVAPEKIEEEFFYWDGLEDKDSFNQDVERSLVNYSRDQSRYDSDGIWIYFNELDLDRKKRAYLLLDYNFLRNYPAFAYKADLAEAVNSALAFVTLGSSLSVRSLYKEKSFEFPYVGLYSTFWNRFPSVPKEDSDFNRDTIDTSHCLFKQDEESKNLENRGILNPIVAAGERSAWNRQTSPLMMKLDSAACQKSLQSQLLIDRFAENMETLSDVQKQNLLLISLFRSSASETPLHEAIKNRDFLDSVTEFVDRGIKLFSKTKKKPDIQTILFFIHSPYAEKGSSCNFFNSKNAI